MFHLPNLTAGQDKKDSPRVQDSTIEELLPLIAALPRPPEDKKFRSAHNAHPATQRYFLSGVRGRTKEFRVSASNPIQQVHALIFDFDNPPKGVGTPKQRTGYEWSYWHRTWSGKHRLIYLLETPILLNEVMWEPFITAAQKGLRVDKLGLGKPDLQAMLNAGQYYCAGYDWVAGGAPLEDALILNWRIEAAKKSDRNTEGLRPAITKLRTYLAERYPGAWPGGWDTFDFGVRGPRFWAGGDADSIIVGEAGIHAFTGNESFLPWTHKDLLGDYANKCHDEKLGEAIEDIYHTGKDTYWKKDGDEWRPWTEKALSRALVEQHGLANTAPKGTPLSEVARALCAIQTLQTLDGVIHLLGKPLRIALGGREYLNRARARHVSPAPGLSHEDQFPRVTQFLAHAFGDEERRRLLTWMQRLYRGHVLQDIQQNLALFLAGPPGAGKNFFVNAILGQLLGGTSDASFYLQEKESDKFNGRLFESPVWAAHDLTGPASMRRIKGLVANREVSCREMHQAAVTMPMLAAIVVTGNDDTDSFASFHSTGEVRDKVLFLQFKIFPKWVPPTDEEIASELPYFGRWLLDQPVDEDLKSARFGLKAWCSPVISARLDDADPTTTLMHIMMDWRADQSEGAFEIEGLALVEALLDCASPRQTSAREYLRGQNAVTRLLKAGRRLERDCPDTIIVLESSRRNIRRDAKGNALPRRPAFRFTAKTSTAEIRDTR